MDCEKFSGLSVDIDDLLKSLNTASDQCKNALDHLLHNTGKAPYIAFNQMMLFGNSFAYWLLVKAIGNAKIKSEEGSGNKYLSQKISTTKFFASQVLTRNSAYLDAILSKTDSFDEFSIEDFARG